MIGMSILFLDIDLSSRWLGMAEIDIFGIILIADDDDDETLCFRLVLIAPNLLVPAPPKNARLGCWTTMQLAGTLSINAIVRTESECHSFFEVRVLETKLRVRHSASLCFRLFFEIIAAIGLNICIINTIQWLRLNKEGGRLKEVWNAAFLHNLSGFRLGKVRQAASLCRHLSWVELTLFSFSLDQLLVSRVNWFNSRTVT